MRIACRCEMCNNIFMQDEDDLMLEFDFKEKKITFICRNPQCRHENIFDLGNWKKQQEHSPLPRIGSM